MPEQVSDAVLEGAELQELLDSPLTYQEVGRTRGNLPDSYHQLHRTLVVGSGHERFEAAVRHLAGLGDASAGRGLGARVEPVGG